MKREEGVDVGLYVFTWALNQDFFMPSQAAALSGPCPCSGRVPRSRPRHEHRRYQAGLFSDRDFPSRASVGPSGSARLADYTPGEMEQASLDSSGVLA